MAIRIEVVRGASLEIPVLAEIVELDASGHPTAREPIDLDAAGAEIAWSLFGCAGTELARKTSAAGGIEILDQSDPATIGRAVIRLTPGDTDHPPGCFRHEAWIDLADGSRGALIEPSDFKILPAGSMLPTAAPPPDAAAAPQTPAERSFSFAWPTLGGQASVTIPGGGMTRDGYHVDASFDGAPSMVAVLFFENRTAAGFDVVVAGGGALTAGTRLTFHVRDIQ